MSSPPTSQSSIEFKIQNSQVQGQMAAVSFCAKNAILQIIFHSFLLQIICPQFSGFLLQIIPVSVCAQHIIYQFLQQHTAGDLLTYLRAIVAMIILYTRFSFGSGTDHPSWTRWHICCCPYLKAIVTMTLYSFFQVWNRSSILNLVTCCRQYLKATPMMTLFAFLSGLKQITPNSYDFLTRLWDKTR